MGQTGSKAVFLFNVSSDTGVVRELQSCVFLGHLIPLQIESDLFISGGAVFLLQYTMALINII